MKYVGVVTKSESRRRCLLWLNITIITGVIVGAIISVFSDLKECVLLHQYFSPIYSGETVFQVFMNTFISSVIFLLALFFLGFSAIGQPFGIGMLIYRGIGIGFSVAQLYIQGGFKAIPTVLLLILPKAIMISFISALAVREMLKLSSNQFMFLIGKNLSVEKRNGNLRIYCLKFVILVIIMLIISVFDSAINYLFTSII